MQAGAVDHLVKDRISAEVLEKAIRYAIRAAESAAEIRRQSEILSATMAASEIGLAAVEASGRTPIWNQRMGEFLVGPGADQAAVEARVATLLANPALRAGEPFETAAPGTADGVLEFRLSALGNGEFTLACHDVSKRKAIEDALRAAKEEAERLSTAKSMFIARLSHEMRTPLHAVIGFSELLPVAAKAEIADYAGIIAASGRGLVAKIDQMLELSRMDLGKIKSHPRDVPAAAILKDAIARAVQAEPGLAPRLHAAPNSAGLHIRDDHRLLTSAMAEFISNASKYGAPGGAIRLGATALPDGEISLWVGNAIAEGQPPLTADPFESFGQADSRLERSHEGLGVGLTYVRAVAGLHGGRASLIQTSAARDTIAAMELPAAFAQSGAETAVA